MALNALVKYFAITSAALAAENHAHTDVAKASPIHEEKAPAAAEQEQGYQKYIDKYAGGYAGVAEKYMKKYSHMGTSKANSSVSPVDFVEAAVGAENPAVKDALQQIREHAEAMEKRAEAEAREADGSARQKVREIDEAGRKIVREADEQIRKAEEQGDLSREADEALRNKLRGLEEEARRNTSQAEKKAREAAQEAEKLATEQIQRVEQKAFLHAKSIMEKFQQEPQPSLALTVNATSLASSKKAPLVAVAEFTMTPPIDPRPVAAVSLAISGCMVAIIGSAGMIFAHSRRVNGVEGMADSLISPNPATRSVV